MSIGDELRALIADERRILPDLPELRRLLLVGGTVSGEHGEHVVYWSKERLGRTPVITVTHMVIATPRLLAPGTRVVASMQLYASHYFDASLELTILLPMAGSPGPSTTLLYYNRSRVDTFDGLLGGMLRRVVKSRAGSSLEHHLQRLQLRFRAHRSDDQEISISSSEAP